MKKPLIAICPSYTEDTIKIGKKYTIAVEKSGGIPVLMNLTDDEDVIDYYASMADGFIFSGGDDIAPWEFGETVHDGFGEFCIPRDFLELKLAKKVALSGKPMLGICRGIQLLNVAFGGDLYQDIPSELSKKICHSQKPPYCEKTHKVLLEDGSVLSRLSEGEKVISVNSMHHQSVKRVAPGWKCIARSEDGVIEAVEKENYGFALGVQWHPEHLFATDEFAQKIFRLFVEKSSVRKTVLKK